MVSLFSTGRHAPALIWIKVRGESLNGAGRSEMQKKFAAARPSTSSAATPERRAPHRQRHPKWAKVIKDANIKPGN